MKNIMTTPCSTLNPLRLNLALLLLGLGASYAQTPPPQSLYTPVGSGFNWRDNADEANGVFFTVGAGSNVLVSHLGYFNTNATTGLKRSHPVGIYSGTYVTTGGTYVTNLVIRAQVTVPAGTGGSYYNNNYWVQLDPPLLLSANSVYVLAGQSYNGDGDWWQDASVGGAGAATWNAAYVGGSTARGAVYGPGGTTWPVSSTATFVRNGLSKAYVTSMLGNLPLGQAKVLYAGSTNIVLTGGQTLNLYAYAVGQTPTYQWWLNGAAVPGATAQSYSTTVWDTNNGTYYFTATNTVNSVNYGQQSPNISVLVYTYPTNVTVAPPSGQTETLFAGANASFAITSVTGVSPFTYQWYTNGVLDPSFTSASYFLTNVQASTPTTFACVITNAGSTNYTVAFTNTWNISVVAPPTDPYPAAILADSPIGYWRLNEADNGSGNNGTLANDYLGGNSGVYTNTILGQPGYGQGLSNQFGYYPATDLESSAQFGYYPSSLANSNCVFNIQNVSFATNGANAAFSVEAWVKGDAVQKYNAGIVAKGLWANEQFTLDVGGNNYSYRFTYRDWSKAIVGVGSNTNLPDGNWHHLVGVVDQAHSNACLYFDSVMVGSAVTTNVGVYNSAVPVSIGSRQDSAGKYTEQFFGNINDVAVYNYALSSNQVFAHYTVAQIGAHCVLRPPASTNLSNGDTLTLAAIAVGTPPVSCQWYDVTAGFPGTPLAGQTSATLVIPNIQAADYNGHTLALVTSNAYGQATNQTILTVYTTPFFTQQPTTNFNLYAGGTPPPWAFSVATVGPQPISYNWLSNGVPIANATNASFTITGPQLATTTYSCWASNSWGSTTGGVITVTVLQPGAPYPAAVLVDHPISYWRLNEGNNNGTGNNGVYAKDYLGGNYGTYSNTVLGQVGYSAGLSSQLGYSPATEPDVTSAQFGYYNTAQRSTSNYVANIPLNFAIANAGTNFSIEAWVNGDANQDASGLSGGIVAKGLWANEQFTLDSTGSPYPYRFTMRDANKNFYSAQASTNLSDGNWHHLVGVLDEAHSNLCLYVDGVKVASSSMPTATNGVFASSVPMTIGCRQSSSGVYGQQFFGTINDVAIYNYALSATQVLNHYTAAGIPPRFLVSLPAATYVNQGATLTLPATITGTAVSYQWYDTGTDGSQHVPLANQTNATLVLPNISPALDQHILALTLSNLYAQVTGTTTLTVYSAPVFTLQPSTGFVAYQGHSVTWTLTAGASGAAPIAYQWLSNGVPIAGATSTNFSLTSPSAPGQYSYSCWASNMANVVTGAVASVTILAAPAGTYPAAVVADNPVGFWRLNETPDNLSGNSGTVANDYWSGNCGVYSNTVLAKPSYSQALASQFGYSPAAEPSLTAAQFGWYPSVGATSNYVAGIPNIDLSAPTNTSGHFSIEAWVNGDAQQDGLSINAAGIVAKGAWAAEQFTLDTGGATPTTYAYRFTTRDSGGVNRAAVNVTNVPDGNWHHLVGVLDQANSNLCLYVDGVKVATTACSPSNGVLSSSVPVSIGSRMNTSGGYVQQFFGTINDVAIYNYALSSTQVVAHYLAAGFPPQFTLQPPAMTNINEGTTLMVSPAVYGSPALSYQWYDTSTASAIPDQTNATLVINSISQAQYGWHTLSLTVSNTYGQATSSGITVNVQAGAPTSVALSPATVPTMYAGLPVAFTATAAGTEPFSYQWAVDGSTIAGATTSAYTNVTGLGTHTLQCTVNNPQGPGSPSPAAVTVTGVDAPTDSYGLGILADQPIAFWRLDEPAYASAADDFVGGHTASYYTAYNALPGFSPAYPAETSTGFAMSGETSGSLAYEDDQSGSGIANLDFSKPAGLNAQFSAEAWVNAPAGQANSSPVIAKGYGNGGEQYDIEVYGGHFRFFFRTAASVTRIATSPNLGPDGTWHHVVGVCDEANGAIRLYVDGVLNATNTAVPGEGLLSPLPVGGPILTSIGARMTSSTDNNFSYQLSQGEVAQVALYNYSLSSTQIRAHYAAAAEPPAIGVQPTPASLKRAQSLPVTYSVLADGYPTLAYQWRKDGQAITGQTTSSLSFAGIVPSDTASYDVVITNAYGAVTSSVAALTVVANTSAYEAQVLADGVVNYWRLNETTGTTAYDYVGGLNSTYGANTTNGVAGPSAPLFGGFETTNVAVSMDAAVGTAGAGYVTAPVLGLNTNTLTIICWVYPYADITGSAYDGVVFSRASTYSKGIGYVPASGNNQIGYTWNQNNINTYGGPAHLLTPPGQWSFVALTIAPTQAVLYVGTNGVLRAATNAVAHDVEAFDGALCFGADTTSLPGRIFNGKMDEVAVFNYTLSPSQMASLYSLASVPLAPSIVLNHPANNAALAAGADVAFDSTVTTNGNTITKVEYFTGTTKLGESSAAAFAYNLMGGFAPGSYPLYAQLDYSNPLGAHSVLSATNSITVNQSLLPPANMIWGPSATAGYYTLSFSGGQASTWYLIGTNDVAAPKATWPVLQTAPGGSSGSFEVPVGTSGDMFFMIRGQ
jgi:Concanavalin A-like lectin/glucanases superfamily